MYLIFAGNTPPIGGINDLHLATPDAISAKAEFQNILNGGHYDWGTLVTMHPNGSYDVTNSFEKGGE